MGNRQRKQRGRAAAVSNLSVIQLPAATKTTRRGSVDAQTRALFRASLVSETADRKTQFSVTQTETYGVSQIELGIVGGIEMAEKARETRNNHRKIKGFTKRKSYGRKPPFSWTLKSLQLPSNDHPRDRPLFAIASANCFTTPLAYATRRRRVCTRKGNDLFFLERQAT